MSDPQFEVKFNVQSILAVKQIAYFVSTGEYTMTAEFRARLAELNATCARHFVPTPDPGGGEELAIDVDVVDAAGLA